MLKPPRCSRLRWPALRCFPRRSNRGFSRNSPPPRARSPDPLANRKISGPTQAAMVEEPPQVRQNPDVPVRPDPHAVDEVGPRKVQAILGNLWRMESQQGLRLRAKVILNCSTSTCGHRSLLDCSFCLRRKHAGRRRIYEPHNPALWGVDYLCRKLLRFVWPLEYRL